MRPLEILLGAAIFVAARPIPAQVAGAPEDYGTQDDSILIIGFMEFDPQEFEARADSALGLRWSTSGGELIAPVAGIPNGAVLTHIGYYFHDGDPGNDLTFRLCENYINVDGSRNDPDRQCFAAMTTSGSPGDGALFQLPDWPIVYRRDVDGDGDLELVQYNIRATTPGEFATSIRAARLRFKRRVSPAPPLATFNDVPTGHPFFQFVEALADSGITVGCGNGNYCPDAPLTRGQMAVFLAKALGLHWPWDAQ
jgi:S-layer family protein